MRTIAEVGLGNPHVDGDSRAAFEDILLEANAASALLENMLELARPIPAGKNFASSASTFGT